MTEKIRNALEGKEMYAFSTATALFLFLTAFLLISGIWRSLIMPGRTGDFAPSGLFPIAWLNISEPTRRS